MKCSRRSRPRRAAGAGEWHVLAAQAVDADAFGRDTFFPGRTSSSSRSLVIGCAGPRMRTRADGDDLVAARVRPVVSQSRRHPLVRRRLVEHKKPIRSSRSRCEAASRRHALAGRRPKGPRHKARSAGSAGAAAMEALDHAQRVLQQVAVQRRQRLRPPAPSPARRAGPPTRPALSPPPHEEMQRFPVSSWPMASVRGTGLHQRGDAFSAVPVSPCGRPAPGCARRAPAGKVPSFFRFMRLSALSPAGGSTSRRCRWRRRRWRRQSAPAWRRCRWPVPSRPVARCPAGAHRR